MKLSKNWSNMASTKALSAGSHPTYSLAVNNGYISTASQITYCVPKGSLIGPLLFLLYINDLPNSPNSGTARMYADDTSISFVAATNYDLEIMLKTDLANVNTWLKANKLSLNVAKTEFMITGSRKRLQTEAEVSIQAHIEERKSKELTPQSRLD